MGAWGNGLWVHKHIDIAEPNGIKLEVEYQMAEQLNQHQEKMNTLM